MLFAIVFVVQSETSANDGLATIRAFLSSQLVVPLANGVTLEEKVISSKDISANDTFQASRVICFLARFNAIAFDGLLANAAFVGDFFVILGTIGFAVFLKEFAIDAFLADATFEAFFVVNLAKSRATFHCDWFGTHATFSNLLVHSFGHPVANLGLNLRIVEIRLSAHGPVVARLGPGIGGNGSADLRGQSAPWRFPFGRHLDTGVTTHGYGCLGARSAASGWRR